MASKTQRFGLNHFGGAVPGSLADDAGKFTGRDRQLIDRLLGAFEIHDHGGGERLADPSAAPALTLATTGGQLPGGETYHYRVAYVDKFGLETAAGPEVSVTAPGSLAPPPTPGVTGLAGGTLASGVYYYVATFLTADGSETTTSAPAVINLQPDFGTVRLTFADAFDAAVSQVSFWRQGPLDSGFTRIATVAAAGFTQFDDDGSVPSDPCACDPENLPPDVNETSSTNAITIQATAADLAAPSGVKKWRIYRTTVAGSYPAASLVAEVTETVDELTGELVSSYVDDGTSNPTPGTPLEVSQTLLPSQAISAGASEGGPLYLEDSGGQVWRITATRAGVIETRSTPVDGLYAPAGLGIFDSSSNPWRITIGTDGALTTIQAAHALDDVSFADGTLPELPTVDGAVTWQLGVALDGSLETYGVDDSTVVEGIGVRRIIASSTEPTNPQVGDLWIEI